MPITTPEQLALARRVHVHLIANPKLHDQTVWMDETACGTAGCVAGWAVTLEGLTIQDRFDDWGDDTTSKIPGGWACTPEGRKYPTGETAARLLGLNGAEAERLFLDIGTEPEALTYLANYIAAGERRLADQGVAETEAAGQ